VLYEKNQKTLIMFFKHELNKRFFSPSSHNIFFTIFSSDQQKENNTPWIPSNIARQAKKIAITNFYINR
jgi:hypothetical protein